MTALDNLTREELLSLCRKAYGHYVWDPERRLRWDVAEARWHVAAERSRVAHAAHLATLDAVVTEARACEVAVAAFNTSEDAASRVASWATYERADKRYRAAREIEERARTRADRAERVAKARWQDYEAVMAELRASP